MERVELMAYKLALPLHIKFHDVFHVSLLEKNIYIYKKIYMTLLTLLIEM